MNQKWLTRLIALLLLVGIAVLMVVLVRGAWVIYVGDRYRDQAVVIDIESGATIRDVRDTLVDAGVLRAPVWFLLHGKVTNRVVHAGRFSVAPGTPIRELYRLLSNSADLELQITMIEGWTLQDLEDHLVSRGLSTEADMALALSDPALKTRYVFLQKIPDSVDVEGYLFPDTYRFFPDATAADVVDRLLHEFETRVVVARESDIAASGYTLHEVVTMASLLEREVRHPEDMAMVSDVIRKRLEDGMPLQLDATVNYATGKNDPGVSLADTQVDSPYNTYKYPGLPIGPISNPGDVAFNAALNPQENPYYFYLTTPDGTVVYARTNEEHIQNKARYLE